MSGSASGWGEVTVLDEQTRIQDGPAWWAAREAIEQTATMQRQPGLALVRTTSRSRGNRDDLDAINAALMCRDHLLGSLDDRSLRILQGLMNKATEKGHRTSGGNQSVRGVAARGS